MLEERGRSVRSFETEAERVCHRSRVGRSDIPDEGADLAPWKPYGDLNAVTKKLVLGSHFLNFMYWMLPHSDTDGYSDLLLDGFRDPDKLNAHLVDLGRFVAYAEEHRVPLLVVVFPFLLDLETSKIFTEPIGDFFSSHDVPVVDVAALAREMPDRSRVVNLNDRHPSASLHLAVGQAIARTMSDRGWLEDLRATDSR